MKQIILCLILVFFGVKIYADSIIKGYIKTEKEPLPYVYVTLLSPDSIIIKMTQTDSLGFYSIDITDDSQKLIYNKEVQFNVTSWGNNIYSEKFIFSGIDTINKDIYIHDKNTINLNEVTVTSVKNSFSYKNDRFVFQPSERIVKGSSAFDLLKQVPLIKADEEDISLLYQSGTIIYLNNKPLRIPLKSLLAFLRSTPAENIKDIEVITNPGSEFDAGIGGGIINIKLKKLPDDGIIGSVELSDKQARRNNQFGSANLQYRKQKLGINMTISGWDEPTEEKNNNRLAILSSNLYQQINSNSLNKKKGIALNLNLDLEISDNHSVNLMIDGNFQNQNRTQDAFTHYYTTSQNFMTSDSLTKTITKEDGNKINNLMFVFNYEYKFNKKGGKINVATDYVNYKYDQNVVGETFRINPSSTQLSWKYTSNLPQKINSYNTRLDLSQPLKSNSSLKLGIHYSHNYSNNNYVFKNWNSNEYINDPHQSNHFLYTENIAAAYFVYSRNWSKNLSTTLGLRTEYTYNKGEQLSIEGQDFTNEYFYLFPSLFIAYNPKENLTFSYSLTSRLHRPQFWELNPFRTYINQNTYVENNPSLKSPRIFQNELAVIINKKYTILAQFQYRNHDYAQILISDSTNTDILKYNRLNYGTGYQGLLGLIANWSFFNDRLKITPTLMGIYMQSNMHIQSIIDDKTRSLAGYFRLNNSFSISEKHKWWSFLNYEYTTSGSRSNTHMSATSVLDIGIKKAMNNWIFTLWVNDLFYGKKMNFISTTNTIKSNNWQNPDTRNISLKITYNFGKKAIKRNKQTQVANDEIRGRLQQE